MHDAITWPATLRLLYVTASSVAAAIIALCAWDFIHLRGAHRAAALEASARSAAPAASRLRTEEGGDRRDTLRVRLARAAHPSRSRFGLAVEASAVVLGFADYLLFVCVSYLGLDAGSRSVGGALSLFFLARLAARILVLTEPGQRAGALLTLDGVVDLSVTVSEVYSYAEAGVWSFAFLRLVTVYFAVARLDHWLDTRRFLLTRVQRLIVRICMIIAAFLASFGATIAMLETLGNPSGWAVFVGPLNPSTGRPESWTLFNSIYWSVTTMATVGFGDMAPTTFLGRAATTVYVVAGIVLTSRVISALVNILQLQARLKGAGHVANAELQPLVLFCGEPGILQLDDILRELFPPHARGSRIKVHAVVVLEHDLFRAEFASHFSSIPEWAGRVTYLCGSVIDEATLRRAGAFSAELQAVVVLQRRFARDDTANLLRVLAVRKFLPGAAVRLVLGDSRNVALARAAGVHADAILCLDVLRHGLLAANVATPGAATLLVNLFCNDPPQRPPPGPPWPALGWRAVYSQGVRQQVREVVCPRWLVGRTVRDATALLYVSGLVRDRGAAPVSVEAGLRFANAEELVRSLASRIDETACEGAVLFAVRSRLRSSRGKGARSVMHGDLDSPRKLARSDSLFLIASTLRCVGVECVPSALPLLREQVADPAPAIRLASAREPASAPPQRQARRSLQLSRGSRRWGADEEASAQLHPPPPPHDLRDHVIVVCDDWLGSIGEHFLAPLRRVSDRPVVILSPAAPPLLRDLLRFVRLGDAPAPAGGDADGALGTPQTISPTGVPATTAALERSSSVYYVRGSPLVEADLRRARLTHARRCVVFAKTPDFVVPQRSEERSVFFDSLAREQSLDASNSAEQRADAAAVLTTMMIEQRLARFAPALLLGTTTELVSAASAQLLPNFHVPQELAGIHEASGHEPEPGGAGDDRGDRGERGDRGFGSDSSASDGGSVGSLSGDEAGGRAEEIRRTVTDTRALHELMSPLPLQVAVAGSGRVASVAGGNAAAAPQPGAFGDTAEGEPHDSRGWLRADTLTPLRWSPRFAAGRLFATSSLSALLVSSLFHPSLGALVSSFARGNELRLRHVAIPPELFGPDHAVAFGRLLVSLLLDHRMLVVGLLRHNSEGLPFVLTNPAMNLRVSRRDVAFVSVPIRSEE